MKSRFLSLFCMVVADGVVEARELETFYRIGREHYGLTPEEIAPAVVSLGSSFVMPTRMEERVSLLYQMAQIAWADGEIDDTERDMLVRYAVRLEFLPENAEAIASFMLDKVKQGVSEADVIAEIVEPEKA